MFIRKEGIMPKKVILSDIGNVVVGFDNRRLSRLIAQRSEFDQAEIHRLVFSGPERLTRDYTRGRISTDDFRQLVLARFACRDKITPTEFDTAFADVFSINCNVQQLWHRLRQRGATIIAVSDLEELRHRQLEKIGVMALFDEAVLSYHLQIAKPDRKMFTAALDLAGVPADQAVFVDDLPANIQAAQLVGLPTHQYGRFNELLYFLSQHGFDVSS
jgi:putative hydrolase of the HAD superfamily